MWNIEKETVDNNDFRRVIFTGENMQLVLMSLNPKEEIGMEVHDDVDQFFRIEEGEAEFVINGKKKKLHEDDAIIVKAGEEHNVINIGKEKLKLYTIYSPPNHPDGTVHKTKKQADEYEKSHHH